MHSNYKDRCHFHKKMPKNLSQYNHFRWRLNCVCNYSEWNNGIVLHQARSPILLIGYLLNHAQMFGNLCTFYSDSLPYINSSFHYQAFFHTLLNCLLRTKKRPKRYFYTIMKLLKNFHWNFKSLNSEFHSCVYFGAEVY